ncbi:MAG: ornithine carbamoyltransferase [Myxococcota bacterium]
MSNRHLLSLGELSSEELVELLELGRHIKLYPRQYRETCKGQSLAMIFQKPSLRTRVSFEVGIYQLGGQGQFLGPEDLQLHRGEAIADTGRVLSRYVDGIMARVFRHSDLEGLAEHSEIPVINGLSDYLHPCQVLADLLTVMEKKETLRGLSLAYIGDGNNMSHSLMLGCSLAGISSTIAHPPGYAPKLEVVEKARALGAETGATVTITEDPSAAVSGVDLVYTDVWTSMGQEDEHIERLARFQNYRVTPELMARAAPDALFMHCLPAHRGEEVSAAVIDGPQSVVFDQSENRLHAQKAVMVRKMASRR